MCVFAMLALRVHGRDHLCVRVQVVRVSKMAKMATFDDSVIQTPDLTAKPLVSSQSTPIHLPTATVTLMGAFSKQW